MVSRLPISWVFCACLLAVGCGADAPPPAPLGNNSPTFDDDGDHTGNAMGEDAGVDAGDGDPTDDDGVPTDDDGTPTDDDGVPTDDDGVPTDDDGVPTDDDGVPTDDDGTPTDDDGVPTDDDGTPTDDGGDDGEPLPDGTMCDGTGSDGRVVEYDPQLSDCASFPGTAYVSGTILDLATGLHVGENAEVAATGCTDLPATTTDADGNFVLEVPLDTRIYLTVTLASGDRTLSEAFTLTGDASQNFYAVSAETVANFRLYCSVEPLVILKVDDSVASPVGVTATAEGTAEVDYLNADFEVSGAAMDAAGLALFTEMGEAPMTLLGAMSKGACASFSNNLGATEAIEAPVELGTVTVVSRYSVCP